MQYHDDFISLTCHPSNLIIQSCLLIRKWYGSSGTSSVGENVMRYNFKTLQCIFFMWSKLFVTLHRWLKCVFLQMIKMLILLVSSSKETTSKHLIAMGLFLTLSTFVEMQTGYKILSTYFQWHWSDDQKS